MERREFLKKTTQGALYAAPLIATVSARAADGVYCKDGFQVFTVQSNAVSAPGTLVSGKILPIETPQVVNITGCGFVTSNIDSIDLIGAYGDVVSFTRDAAFGQRLAVAAPGVTAPQAIFYRFSDGIILIPEVREWCYYGQPLAPLPGCEPLNILNWQEVYCRNVGAGTVVFYSGTAKIGEYPITWIPNLLGCPT